jgi:serine/threonine protein kinase
MGFARNGHQRFLVYELLQGGDICSRIQKDQSFDYKQRISVALDASLGLSHLHNASPKVFHRDVKSQNILLDRNTSGRIADFGLALLAKPKAGINGLVVEQCSGTVGYADPLYIASSVVTERREVYSFGMVMLELLTGKPPAMMNANTQVVEFTYESVKASVDGVVKMRQTLAGWPLDIARFWAQLSLACIQDSEKHRPAFVELVGKLRKLKLHVNQPAKVVAEVKPELTDMTEDKIAESKPATWNPFAKASPVSSPAESSEPMNQKSARTIDEVLDSLFGPEQSVSHLVAQLLSLGFTDEQAIAASKKTDKLQVAIDFILSQQRKS